MCFKKKELPAPNGEKSVASSIDAYILAADGRKAIRIYLSFTAHHYYYKLNNASRIKSPTYVDGQYITRAELLDQPPFKFDNAADFA
ncbi:MAG: hypothetical protein LBT20_08675, partial [Clostridiales bacterium]|nr:hypothetical protein [Clostridiales bacterium]